RDKLVTGVQTCALPIYAQFALLQRADPVRAGQGGPHRRHDRYPLGERGIANAHFVLARNFSTRRVDDEFDVAIFYAVENVRTAFPELENFVTGIFAAANTLNVPAVAMIPNPSLTNSRTTGTTACLSLSFTLTKTFPPVGKGGGAAICDFA